MDSILKKAIVSGIVWCLGFFIVRRMLNPNKTLFDKNFKLKQDKQSRMKLIEYAYDAIYGGIAAVFTVLLVHIINENSRGFRISPTAAFN